MLAGSLINCQHCSVVQINCLLNSVWVDWTHIVGLTVSFLNEILSLTLTQEAGSNVIPCFTVYLTPIKARTTYWGGKEAQYTKPHQLNISFWSKLFYFYFFILSTKYISIWDCTRYSLTKPLSLAVSPIQLFCSTSIIAASPGGAIKNGCTAMAEQKLNNRTNKNRHQG